MEQQKRATIYLEASVHRALKLKAAASDRSMSELVSEAVRRALAEDAADLQAIDERKAEREVDFAQLVKSLRRRGRI